MADFEKVGLLVIRDGKALLCRKKHTTSLLILPGGRKEPGETALECLERELAEELGAVRAVSLEFVGVYVDRAAGDESKTVQIELYKGELIGEPEAHSEIAELVWFGDGDEADLLAPSMRNRIFPDLRRRGILW